MESTLRRFRLRTPSVTFGDGPVTVRPQPVLRPRGTAWVSIWISLTALAGHGAVSGGCGPKAADGPASRQPSPASPSAPVDTGLASLANKSSSSRAAPQTLPPDPTAPMTEADKAAWAQQSALNLEQLLKDGEIDDFGKPVKSPDDIARQSNAKPVSAKPVKAEPTLIAPKDAPANTGLAALAAESTLPSPIGVEPTETAVDSEAAEPVAVAPVESPPPAPPTVDPLVPLAAQMATLLRPVNGQTAAPLSAVAALTPLEASRPGALASLADDASPLARGLSPEDLSTLRAAREQLLNDPAAPAELASAARGSAPVTPAAASTPATPKPPAFRIARSAFCTRVSGFGRFEPYASTTFVAGRTIRAVVYAEVDGFGSRPARTGDPLQPSVAMGDQVSVQLSQTLTLYSDKDGLLAWHRPAQSVTETSRSVRRDFYLIQVVELPATLSVGRYNLKIIVADATSGAEAESIIPITIVADPGLLRAGQ